MSNTLIVEDGSVVANANSYATLVQIRNYATLRGVAISDNDAALVPLAILAMDYLESKAPEFVGKPASETQLLAWPRQNILDFPNNAIPQRLIDAQCQLVVEQINGITLMPTRDPQNPNTGGFITHMKLGSSGLEQQFSERIATTFEPIMLKVDSLLQSLLLNGGGPWSMRTVRV